MFGTVNPPATKFKRLLPSGQIFRDGPFLFLCRFCFPREKFAPGCPRNDDSHLARPIAPPVLLIGRGPSAAEGRANHHHKPGSRNYDIVGALDYMATFAALAGVTVPDKDLEGKPMIFDGFDMSPVLFGTGDCARKSWFYLTENELSPGAVRVGNY